jgi:putative sterol carrier protein
MTAADYVDLATGKLSHQLAFMTGRLRVNGDLSLATRLRQLLALG